MPKGDKDKYAPDDRRIAVFDAGAENKILLFAVKVSFKFFIH